MKKKKGREPLYKEDLLADAIEIASNEENNCMFHEDVFTRMGVCRQTYYKYELHTHPDVMRLLKQRRVETKLKLRAKWLDSDNATLQIALFKLIANKEEKDSLANTSHLKVDQNEITKNFAKLAEIMDEVHGENSDRPDNSSSE